MRAKVMFGLALLLAVACGKEKPNIPRITPPGSRYLSRYQTMQLVGNFQGWNLDDANSYMELVDDYVWEKIEEFPTPLGIQFKFVPNHSWDPSFGTVETDTGLSGYAQSVTGIGNEIGLEIPEGGQWKFRFNEQTLFFSVTKSHAYTGAIVGRIVLLDSSTAHIRTAAVKLYNTTFELLSTTNPDSLTGNFGFYSLSPDSYVVVATSTGYIPDTIFVLVRNDTVNVGDIVLQLATTRQPPVIDGVNDFIASDLIAVDPTGDMSERNLDLDSLWGVIVGDTLYLGFNAYASAGYGCSYGIYITSDTTRSSGATGDPWNRNVRATFGMPGFALYLWHTEADTIGSVQLCRWINFWEYLDLSSAGGTLAYLRSNHFIECAIPLSALGMPDTLFVELFTTGSENSHAQDTSPSDPNVQFSAPDWTPIQTVLSRFVLITR